MVEKDACVEVPFITDLTLTARQWKSKRTVTQCDNIHKHAHVDTDDLCYSIFGSYLFGSYLPDETVNVESVHVSETNSKVGNTVACSDMSGSLSGSLSDETINAEGDRDHHHGRGP